MKTLISRMFVFVCTGLFVLGTFSCSKSSNSPSSVKPVATTKAASSVGPKTATLNGTVNAQGLVTYVTFEYGTSVSYGQTISAAQYMAAGDTNTTVNIGISGLKTNTTYHFRVKAVAPHDSAVGSDMTFTTAASYNLNGMWDNGNYTMQINGTAGTFATITAGNWLGELNAGYIAIGNAKLRNIAAKTDSTWSCDDLWWHETNGYYDGVMWSDAGSGSMSISEDGNTLLITSSSGSLGTSSYNLYRVVTQKAIITQKKKIISINGSGND